MKTNPAKKVDIFALFLPEIRSFLKERNFISLKNTLKNITSMDLTEGIKQLEKNEKVIVFKLLGPKKAIEVFEGLLFGDQKYLLDNLDSQEVSEILNEMASDERADLFKDLKPKVVK
ncbi:MAG: hypothetical protein KKA34_05070, partial [Candidatus Omnitrophica bacterium]|nr:hypothetical protein [Candidatus Omnitrophota bacterium]